MLLSGVKLDEFATMKKTTNPKPGPSDPLYKRKAEDQLENSYKIKVSNRFDILSESDSESETENTNNPKFNKNIKENNKIPPIVIYSYLENHTKTLDVLKKQLEENSDIKYLGNRLIAYTKSMKDFELLKGKLDESKLEYHTYSTKDSIHHRMVLKGLPPNILADELKTSLLNLKVPVVKITQMIKKIENHEPIKLPMFIVVINNEMQLRDIVKIKKICYCIVSWEKFKSKGIVQCYNCQSFWHIASNCHKQTKCVKCAGQHNPKDCPNNPLKCANCEGVHPANYREFLYMQNK